MSEASPTSEIPQALLQKVTSERQLAGYTVQEINKTGSSLHILNSNEKKGIIRNAEINASSMAVWEFLHTHAQELLPSEIAQRLFGPWEKPQVAPILQRKEGNRVYYSGNQATAYSEFVGYDTLRFSEAFHLDDIFLEYTPQRWIPSEPRWLDCTAYHLTLDLLKDIPTLDPNKKLKINLEMYWDEFSRLNKNKVGREDLLLNKELRRKDVDDNTTFQASLKLIEAGHEITHLLRSMYQEAGNSSLQQEWKGKSTKEILLFLLHLYQTSVQQMELWWLGVSHGHLHLYNTVSKIPEPGSKEASISPLVTSIIDFDRSTISVDKLIENNELYKSVNVDILKAKINDEKINPHLRFLLVFYLPLQAWDENIFRFVQENRSLGIDEIAYLVSSRIEQDIDSPQRYTQFTEFVYDIEKKQLRPEQFPSFRLTLLMLKKGGKKLQSENKELAIVANYFNTQELPSSFTPEVTDTQKLLLLSAFYYQYANEYGRDLNFSLAEYQFIAELLSSSDQVGKNAVQLLEMGVRDYDETSMLAIVRTASLGQNPERELLQKIVRSIFPKDQMEGRYGYAQRDLFDRFVLTQDIDLLLELVQFSTLSTDEGELTYRNLKELIDTNWKIEDDKKMKKELLQKLNKSARNSIGGLFILRENMNQRIKKRLDSMKK